VRSHLKYDTYFLSLAVANSAQHLCQPRSPVGECAGENSSQQETVGLVLAAVRGLTARCSLLALRNGRNGCSFELWALPARPVELEGAKIQNLRRE
jgi:hypothetical protein